MIRKLTTVGTLVLCGLATHCAADPAGEDGEGETSSALSSRVSDTYGVTMFGGAGDYQKMACGLSSRTAQQSNPYYAASSQRYGCKVHLKLTTRSGACVVVSTEDAGPATWVETKAGTPILDVSPAAMKTLFPSAASLGWSDLRKEPRHVRRDGDEDVTAARPVQRGCARACACARRRRLRRRMSHERAVSWRDHLRRRSVPLS